jgi:hypothetical protein
MRVKTTSDLQDKQVKVLYKGQVLHKGVVLGEDEIFKDVILVGVTETTVSDRKPTAGQKYISIYRARRRELEVVA